eukprot:g2586.t1
MMAGAQHEATEKEAQAANAATQKKKNCDCNYPEPPDACPDSCKEVYEAAAKVFCKYNKCKGKCPEEVMRQRSQASLEVGRACTPFPRCGEALEELLFAPPPKEIPAGPAPPAVNQTLVACVNKCKAKSCTADKLEGKQTADACAKTCDLRCRGVKVDVADKGEQAAALAEAASPGGGFTKPPTVAAGKAGEKGTVLEIKYTVKEVGNSVVCAGTTDPNDDIMQEAKVLWDESKVKDAENMYKVAKKTAKASGSLKFDVGFKDGDYYFACATTKADAASTVADPARSSKVEWTNPSSIGVRTPAAVKAKLKPIIPKEPALTKVVNGELLLLRRRRRLLAASEGDEQTAQGSR